MREILFRGKRLDNWEWIEGFFWKDIWGDGESCYILYDGEDYQVDPNTVGQYTGLTDKSGVKIFEGDIVQIENPKPFKPYVATIKYEDAMFTWGVYRFGEFEHLDKVEVIGNIHDNPELMEGGAT